MSGEKRCGYIHIDEQFECKYVSTLSYCFLEWATRWYACMHDQHEGFEHFIIDCHLDFSRFDHWNHDEDDGKKKPVKPWKKNNNSINNKGTKKIPPNCWLKNPSNLLAQIFICCLLLYSSREALTKLTKRDKRWLCCVWIEANSNLVKRMCVHSCLYL